MFTFLAVCLLVQDDYSFIHLNRVEAARLHMDQYYYRIESGYIDAYVDFVHEKYVINAKYAKANEQQKSDVKQKSPRSYTGKPIFPPVCYNESKSGTEDVYEFRSRKLIPCTNANNGNFVPDEEDAVITNEEYIYKINRHRIYNLPGKFVKKEELKKEMELAEKAGLLFRPAVK